jgi:hypothetical protein
MPELNDPEYYAARAEKARELAEAATDREIAAIHRRMADSYFELAELIQPQKQVLRIVSE